MKPLQMTAPQDYGTVCKPTHEPEDPRQAPWLSRALFAYASPLMRTGNTRQLNMADLWQLPVELRASVAYSQFKTQYEAHCHSVPRAVFVTYAPSLLLCGLGALLCVGCSLLAPAVLNHVIDVFAASVEIDMLGLSLWLTAFFASRLLNAFVTSHVTVTLEMTALQVTASLKSLMIEKAMRRCVQSKKDEDAVDISNLFSTDAQNLIKAVISVNNIWVMPIQIIVVVYMLYIVLGVAAFAGVGVILLSMWVSFLIAKRSGRLFGEIMDKKDDRTKAVKEVFQAIQIVKLNAWEQKFSKKIKDLRALEFSVVTRYVHVLALSVFVLWGSPILVSTVSFTVYTLALDQSLTAAKVFTALALFNVIRDPLREIPTVIQTCTQALVSLGRFSQYLDLDEYDYSSMDRNQSNMPKDMAVLVSNGTFGWVYDTPLLSNVNIEVKKGDLVVVHGSVGSGKSSLCSAILGEMMKLTGDVSVQGRLAYYSQQPWIQNMTIRDNILFGSAFDAHKYSKVIDACGLVPDLKQLPAGDSTEIGQKGVNLSGGQKARLSLARACYSDADILILDSPLAAVDAVVQSEIFSKCICGLLADKTIVLVTHSPDIIASGAVNYKILADNGSLTCSRMVPEKPRRAYSTKVYLGQDKETSVHDIVKMSESGRLVNDEEREEGRVSKTVFMKYFRSVGGVKVVVFLLLVQTLWQGFQISSDLWLSHWTSQNFSTDEEDKTAHMLTIYALLGGASALMVLARSMTVATAGLHGSRHLFDSMTNSLLHAPLRFFDSNPIGRIVNRYGDDLSNVDFELPGTFGGLLAMAFFTVFQLATAVWTVKFLGVFILPIVYLYVTIANFYLAPSREVSRLWKVSASPVLSQVTQAEQGVSLIRAFGIDYVDRTIAENHKLNDINHKVWFAETIVSQWFQLRMQLLGCGIVILIVSSLVYLHEYLSPGLIGLAFTYALSVDAGIADLVFTWSSIEVEMVSPERILEYTDIPAEGIQNELLLEPPREWPHEGSITFDDVVFNYKPGAQPVLNGLSFKIKPNEKIGIVGRTGAGKSSLTMALFRINELVSGRILIDGRDIATMPLHSLRSKMAIIPQTPVLFKGPLRSYMDPFQEFTDAQIWTALEKVEMKEQVAVLEGQLSYELSENGENFSVGERQMLCMARALLTQARVVVMDEATASIDHTTEKKLQEMIERDFEDATVLTIAHRLATVLSSDRIMVLSDGRVVEFDSPKMLVANSDGVFYQLAKEGGYLDHLTRNVRR